jgi:hypothetical protein
MFYIIANIFDLLIEKQLTGVSVICQSAFWLASVQLDRESAAEEIVVLSTECSTQEFLSF